VPADEPRDLLDVLLSPSGPQLADDVVIRTLEAVLRASHGVPGATLTWALRELAADPCLVDRIRAEAGRIDTALTSTAVEPSDLPYTEALVKELLRVYPPTWLMGRTVLRPARLGEWQFPAGHQVMFSPYLSHRDPRWWPEPDRFRPERWLEANRPYQGQAYYPFGAGPRICLGNQVGMLQLTLAIARLADRYEVLSGNLDQAKPDPRALLVPKGLRIRLVPRRN
jgi:unspecific monooxygenase